MPSPDRGGCTGLHLLSPTVHVPLLVQYYVSIWHPTASQSLVGFSASHWHHPLNQTVLTHEMKTGPSCFELRATKYAAVFVYEAVKSVKRP